MLNFTPTHARDDIKMWIICTAIGKDHDLISKMKKNEDGTYPVLFSVGGIGLDFGNVAKRIEEIFDDAVTDKAQELLNTKYSDLLNELADIQERVENQKQRFKYDWEETQ